MANYVYSQFDMESRMNGRLKIAWLNQPSRMNALTKPLLLELAGFIEFYSRDADTRCIVLAAKGDVFSSGQNVNIEDTDTSKQGSPKEVKRLVADYYNPLINAIRYARKPIIALVNGHASDTAANIALACDITLASESASFSQIFSRIGLIPDAGGTYFLPKNLGLQKAHYLAFTGKKVSAKEAEQMGMIADVFPTEEFEQKAFEVIEDIVNMPTQAIWLTKRAFRKSNDNRLNEQLRLESDYQGEAAATEDYREGIEAHYQKRKAQFKGR